MSPRPLTRQESQARTRSKLVQSAEKVFLKRGYVAASIGQIARQAGYTTGAVYSNFESKEHLGLAVLERRMVDVASSLQAALAEAEPTVGARLAVLDAWGSGLMASEPWVVLVTEFLLAARHKPAIRKKVAEEFQLARGLLANILRQQQDETQVDWPLSPEEMAAGLLALSFGLSIQRVADPDVPPGTFTSLIGATLGEPARAASTVG